MEVKRTQEALVQPVVKGVEGQEEIQETLGLRDQPGKQGKRAPQEKQGRVVLLETKDRQALLVFKVQPDQPVPRV